MEIWKDIPNYEGLYQASSEGRIKALERVSTTHKRFKKRVLCERIMKPRYSHPAGYKVTLWKDGAEHEYLVARLIASAFYGSPKQGDTVNHKDGDRYNNKADNLEWMSLGDNIRYGFENGQYSNQVAITTFSESGEWKTFRSQSECSRQLGKSVGYVSFMIKNNRVLRDKNGNTFQYVVHN